MILARKSTIILIYSKINWYKTLLNVLIILFIETQMIDPIHNRGCEPGATKINLLPLGLG